MRPIAWAIIGTLAAVTAGCALRQPLGRSRPDLAALLSPDAGLEFDRTYSSGRVGPFNIGESRSVARERLSALPLLDQDKAQLADKSVTWTVSLEARSGGYNVYTLRFDGDRLASVEAIYSVWQGL